MKKYLTAGLLAVCLATPAIATTKLSNNSPDEPVHRRAIVLCIGVFVCLHAYRHRMTREERILRAFLR